MGNITAADAVITLAVETILTTPQTLQGFSADDVSDIPSIRSAEVIMGVDGVLSGAFVFMQVPQTIVLQADSPSNDFFDTWWIQNQGAKTNFAATGLIILPAIGRKSNMTKGFLTGYKPLAQIQKTLRPRIYEITWEKVVPAPV